jgi:hypothetical protein
LKGVTLYRYGGTMQFARKIVNAEDIIDIIQLPEELRKREVEIIVLPIDNHNPKKHSTKNGDDIIDRLLANPLKIAGFNPFSREEIYEG